MAAKRVVMVGVVLAIASTTAVAFQEQTAGGGGAAPKAVVQPSAPQSPQGGGAALNVPQAPVDTGKGLGTEIRIPGLGKLGVIPKVDFGLELLYGASEPKPSDAGRAPVEDQQLMIRGRVPLGR